MRAAILGRHGVAVGIDEAVADIPGDGPFARRHACRACRELPEKMSSTMRVSLPSAALHEILQPAGIMEDLARRHVVAGEAFVARPADFDAAEQIGLGARHPENARGREAGLGAEDLRVGVEAVGGAAPVVHLAEFLKGPHRLAARELLAVKLLVARHLDDQIVAKSVDHGNADAMQAARGLIGLGVEFAAGMQRGHDDLERRPAREFRVLVDRDAAAVVGYGQIAVFAKMHLDAAGMAGDRLVHGIVDDFGEQVVQRVGVGAADIHARPPPHRLEPFEHLDIRGRIAAGWLLSRTGFGGLAGAGRRRRGRWGRGGIEKIIALRHAISSGQKYPANRACGYPY